MPGIIRTTLPYLLILEINGVSLCVFQKAEPYPYSMFTKKRLGRVNNDTMRFRIQKITDQQVLST